MTTQDRDIELRDFVRELCDLLGIEWEPLTVAPLGEILTAARARLRNTPGQPEHTGTEWGLRQANGWVAHMHDRPDAEETQKLHPDAVLVCRYVGQWSELEPTGGGLSPHPAVSKQPAPGPDVVVNRWGEPEYPEEPGPAASEDTIEQAARTAYESFHRQSADTWRHQGLYDYEPWGENDIVTDFWTTIFRDLAARGLLADGTDRRRIGKALALHCRGGLIRGSEPYYFCHECSGHGQIVEWPCNTVAALTDTEYPAALTGGQP